MRGDHLALTVRHGELVQSVGRCRHFSLSCWCGVRATVLPARIAVKPKSNPCFVSSGNDTVSLFSAAVPERLAQHGDTCDRCLRPRSLKPRNETAPDRTEADLARQSEAPHRVLPFESLNSTAQRLEAVFQ